MEKVSPLSPAERKTLRELAESLWDSGEADEWAILILGYEAVIERLQNKIKKLHEASHES